MPSTSPAGADAGLVLAGVTMELAGDPGPATVVPDVTVTLSAWGVSVAPPPPMGPVSLPWSSLGAARCGEPGLLPDGSPAVAATAVVSRRIVRWLVPAAQMPPERAVAVDHFLAARTGRHDVAGALPASLRADPGSLRADPGSLLRRLGGRARGGLARGGLARGGPVVTAMWAAVAALVAAGALLWASGLPGTQPPAADHGGASGSVARAAGRARAEARAVARAVSLTRVDLPPGWTASPTAHGPLSGFVGTEGLSGARGGAGADPGVARRYERCVGIGRSQGFLLGPPSPPPLAHATSGPYAGPVTGPPLEVVALTTVYGSAGPVGRGLAELGRAAFPSCLAAAIGTEFRASARTTAQGARVAYGRPTGTRIAVPQGGGARASGVDVVLPLRFAGSETTVQLGFVFVTAGRIESTIVTFAAGGAFPASVVRSSAAALEHDAALRRRT